MSSRALLRLYYAATALFLVLDVVAGVNVRIAFFDDEPVLRAGYYFFCFACLGVTLRWPGLTEIVGAFESLVALAALIVSFGARVMLPTPAAAVTVPEVVNFVLASSVAYAGWVGAASSLQRRR